MYIYILYLIIIVYIDKLYLLFVACGVVYGFDDLK